MKRNWRSRTQLDVGDDGVVSLAGASLLTTTARVLGLDRGLSQRLSAWTPRGATHDTGKVILDLAVALAVGGDCPADVAVLRGQPRLFGAVASDPTVSRRIDALAGDVEAAATAIRSARAQARALRLKWAPLSDNGALPIDIDATILIAHSDKENATPTYKRTFGHAPLLAYLDHGEGGTGEPLAVLLRPGRANANNAADNITVLRDALTQLPEADRDRVLVRTDAAGGTHAFLAAVTELGLEYSVGFAITAPIAAAVRDLPERAWTPAYDGDGIQREGADVAELTNRVDLVDWPPGLRVIARRERPHPGAQLRVTDLDGNRITCFVTNTGKGQLAKLERRHRGVQPGGGGHDGTQPHDQRRGARRRQGSTFHPSPTSAWGDSAGCPRCSPYWAARRCRLLRLRGVQRRCHCPPQTHPPYQLNYQRAHERGASAALLACRTSSSNSSRNADTIVCGSGTRAASTAIPT